MAAKDPYTEIEHARALERLAADMFRRSAPDRPRRERPIPRIVHGRGESFCVAEQPATERRDPSRS